MSSLVFAIGVNDNPLVKRVSHETCHVLANPTLAAHDFGFTIFLGRQVGFRFDAVCVELLRNFRRSAILSDQLKDIANDRNLFLVWNEQLFILGIIVSEWRISSVPIATLATLSDFIRYPLTGKLSFPLSQREQQVQEKFTCWRVGRKSFRCGNKDHAMLLEDSPKFVEVSNRACQAIQPIDDDRLNVPCFDLVNEFFPPELVAEGNTPMRQAYQMALMFIERWKKSCTERKVDYFRPWLVNSTDGQPTDSWRAAAEAIAKTAVSPSKTTTRFS